ncbi:MAG: ArsA family ATPase [Actinomycetota bacterium]
MSLRDALASKEIVVVCGSGGVGKTSISAAIALDAAMERRVIVVTIDPAKRLASALGLESGLGHAETKVELPDGAKGSLHAAMLDMKTAWDELIDKYADSRHVAEDIKSNRIYRGISEQFVGSQGYMAMERLADLHECGEYDLIVIDTPPTRSALDFLEAPKRMTDFIGGSLLRWMAKPYSAAGKLGMRAFNFTASPFLRIADRVLGSQVLEDLSALVIDFQNMYDDFKLRAEQVLNLLCSPQTGFVVVTTLEGPPFREAEFFVDRLVDEKLPLAGLVANRVIPPRFAPDGLVPVDQAAEVAEAAGLDPGRARQALVEAATALDTLSILATRDAARRRELGHRSTAPIATVPLFTEDVHDLEGLRRLAGYVLDEPSEETPRDEPSASPAARRG